MRVDKAQDAAGARFDQRLQARVVVFAQQGNRYEVLQRPGHRGAMLLTPGDREGFARARLSFIVSRQRDEVGFMGQAYPQSTVVGFDYHASSIDAARSAAAGCSNASFGVARAQDYLGTSSTTICTPASKAQEVGLGLGAQAGEAQIRRVVTEAGFTRFRRVAETPFNLVYERRTPRRFPMPLFMDTHDHVEGLTAEAVAQAHQADLKRTGEIQRRLSALLV